MSLPSPFPQIVLPSVFPGLKPLAEIQYPSTYSGSGFSGDPPSI